ncbi:EAP30 family protein [Cavenderia fasciculata]|uniref:EAP30 family protein n=1 Tax=Cavenderia fasciculata TaxID=261658 RepID=F4PS89_CACFS|nr:EAP30 family protein [Cavenderia fasciculata]EGG21472.1 EAP30 family protein [Cavenderia fasciculata]|eukprot:XP_004359322.1 EAP30 family protein [Cavenderia fasciculata]
MFVIIDLCTLKTLKLEISNRNPYLVIVFFIFGFAVLKWGASSRRTASLISASSCTHFAFKVLFLLNYNIFIYLCLPAMRRGVGIQAIHKANQHQKQLNTVSEQITSEQIKKTNEQLQTFKSNLEEFAIKHKKDIIKNPEFRKHFQDMCSVIGVDPLASNKGFWSQMLGVGDFYYQLAVQIIDVCLRYRSTNGGLIEINTLTDHIRKMRGKAANEISKDDIEVSIAKLKVLGNGFNILKIESKKIVQSVPCELNKDHTDVLINAQHNDGYTSPSILASSLGWSEQRISSVLEVLLNEGMAWIDNQSIQHKGEVIYWFPSLWSSTFE